MNDLCPKEYKHYQSCFKFISPIKTYDSYVKIEILMDHITNDHKFRYEKTKFKTKQRNYFSKLDLNRKKLEILEKFPSFFPDSISKLYKKLIEKEIYSKINTNKSILK